jgi:hypothetical protein
MEWSTIWTAVGSLASVASAGAIGFAVYQLRFDAWLKAQEIFTDDDFVKARGAVFGYFDNTTQPWPPIQGSDALKVCRKMDEMAHLSRAVGRGRMLAVWGHPITKAWLLLEPTVKQERTTAKWDEKWQAFEVLAGEAVRRNPKLLELRKGVPPNNQMQLTSGAPKTDAARS